MREVIIPLSSTIVDPGGRSHNVRVIGHERADGKWEGRIEFLGGSGSAVSTARETTQPNRTDFEYWASGLEKVYLEGALERAWQRARREGREEARVRR